MPQAAEAVAERHRRDAHTCSSSTTGARIRPSRFDTGIPFGLNARQMNAWLYEGGGNELLREVFYAKHNLVHSRAATPACRWAAGGARRSSRSPTCRA